MDAGFRVSASACYETPCSVQRRRLVLLPPTPLLIQTNIRRRPSPLPAVHPTPRPTHL